MTLLTNCCEISCCHAIGMGSKLQLCSIFGGKNMELYSKFILQLRYSNVRLGEQKL